MPARTFSTRGSHQGFQKIQKSNRQRLKWILFSEFSAPKLPYGTRFEITITFNEIDFLNGTRGIVWATYDHVQAETIQDALSVQNICSRFELMEMDEWRLIQISIPNPEDVQKAIDFIWRDRSGMRLKPDWWYSADNANSSFKKWTNGASR